MPRRHLPLLVVLAVLALAAGAYLLLPRPAEADSGRLRHAIRDAIRQQVPASHFIDAVGEPDEGEMIVRTGDEWAVRARVDLRDAAGRRLSGRGDDDAVPVAAGGGRRAGRGVSGVRLHAERRAGGVTATQGDGCNPAEPDALV